MDEKGGPENKMAPSTALAFERSLPRFSAHLASLAELFRGLFSSRQEIFYELLQEQSAYMVEATTLMLAYLDEPSKNRRKEVKRVEKAADDIRRALVEELNRTFFTPLDREDIYALSRDLDDVVDYAYTTTEELELFELAPTPRLIELANLIHEGACELHAGMQYIRKDPKQAIGYAQRAKKIETRVERVYRRALAELFQPPESVAAVASMFMLREVYRHLSNAADRVDEAANILSDTLVKII